jgi:cell division protein FtsZ
MFDFEQGFRPQARITVVGVGGGGGNAINTMMAAGLTHVDFVAANTDAQHLAANRAPHKIQLGPNLTKGLGAGMNPDVGKNAALESTEEIAAALEGSDMVFVAAGMGGGTGTGAAPVIANIARSLGALTVGVVTKPFRFEGGMRGRLAEEGVNNLTSAVDAIISIPNQNLIALATNNQKMTLQESFRAADGVLLQAVDGLTRLINVAGLVNIDFADVKAIMTNAGPALMGVGRGMGDDRLVKAAQAAVTSPLLDNVALEGATGIIVNVIGGYDLSMLEVDRAVTSIEEVASQDVRLIFGAMIDESLGDEVIVTVMATGFPVQDQRRALGGASSGRPVVPAPRATQFNPPNIGYSPVTQAAARPPTPVAVPAAAGAAGNGPVSPRFSGSIAGANQTTRILPGAASAPMAAPQETVGGGLDSVPVDVQPLPRAKTGTYGSDGGYGGYDAAGPNRPRTGAAGSGPNAGNNPTSGGEDDWDIPAFLRRKSQ